jgi:hypothetical protein
MNDVTKRVLNLVEPGAEDVDSGKFSSDEDSDKSDFE